ncbi:hypothetical protein GCM10025780_22130 [Frondihabitans cladoniiphilus]|uniref:Uncharacterized protein n=1 Tax=Frondihabitans cladoniiphilus TaxID=715785 RepID=A0ABP8W0N1_9MICO
MGMGDAQLGHVLQRHDALGGRRPGQERRQESGLATAGSPRHEHVRALPHGRLEPGPGDELEGAGALEVVEVGGGRPRQPDGQQRPRRTDGWQDRVHPDAVGQTDVGAGGRLVDVPAGERDERHRQAAGQPPIEAERGMHDRTPAAIDPHRPVAVHEDVRDPRVGEQRRERPELGGDSSFCLFLYPATDIRTPRGGGWRFASDHERWRSDLIGGVAAVEGRRCRRRSHTRR